MAHRQGIHIEGPAQAMRLADLRLYVKERPTYCGCLGQRIRQVWPNPIPDRLTIFPVLQLEDDTGLKRSGS